MPNAGDIFITTLKKAHLGWGRHRHTSTRTIINGEGYLQIPAAIARRFNITNTNNSIANSVYRCNSSDGFLTNESLLASGSSKAGYKYAKQFQGKGNLKLLGGWYSHIKAVVGDRIEVKFISSDEILVTKL
ncbi:MAG: hypothetical protein ACQUHE_12080 [Bacteroidia bacterium]